MKINKIIEVVRTTNSGLSSMSLKSSEAIQAVLKRHYKSVTIATVNSLQDLEELALRNPDLVFNGIKYIPSALDSDTHIWVADFLESHGIAVTGSDVYAHVLEADKFEAKQCAVSAGLNTSRYTVVRQHETMISENMHLSYPVFIKPTNKGGGVGIDNDSVAYTFEQMVAKIESISSNHGSDSLIEEYLSGREFSVAILKDYTTHQYQIMPLELIAPQNSNGNRILTHKVKSEDTETFTAVTNPVIRMLVGNLAIDVFHALGARDYGRIDIRMDKQGAPQFLEANLIPSLTENFGNFPKACMLNMNLGFESVIVQIASLGLVRSVADDNEYSEDNTVRKLLPALQV